MAMRPVSKDCPVGWCENIPDMFASAEEARNSMDYLWSSTTTWFQQLVPSRESVEQIRLTKKTLSARFRRWTKAVDGLLAHRSESIPPKTMKGITCLRITQRLAEISLELSVSVNPFLETVWDGFLDDHKDIVRLAQSVLGPPPDVPESAKMRCEFSLDMNLVAPLYAVAVRCREPDTRRQAISLLHQVPRVEGIWSSLIAARVAERMMTLEEAGLEQIRHSSDVPAEARIAVRTSTLDASEKSLTVYYARQGFPDECVSEVFPW